MRYEPTSNFLVAIAILLIVACMLPFEELIWTLVVALIVAGALKLAVLNYNREMRGDFDD